MLINDHRQWLYKGSEGKIFEQGDEIPEGWFDSPNAKKWDNEPKQPRMRSMPVWEEPNAMDVTEPSSDEAPEVFYCEECDKTYKEKRWYDAHMLKKHSTKEDVGVE